MDAGTVIQTLERELARPRDRFGVKSLGLFGSVARGDASPSSDVDILVEFDARPSIITWTSSSTSKSGWADPWTSC